MRMIPKPVMTRLSEISLKLEEHKGVLEGIGDEFTSRVEAVLGRVNDLRNEAHSLIDSAYSDGEAYYDERSEKWQEGDAGSAYKDWIDGLQEKASLLDEEVTIEELEVKIEVGIIDTVIEACEIEETPQ